MKKILIYDHDRTFCLRLAEWVDKNKFEVRYFDDHKIARRMIVNGLFDIIVIYVSCHLCDGMRLVTDILELSPATPVLCALDKDDNALLISLIRKGAIDYIDKRFINRKDFCMLVSRIVADKESCEELYEYQGTQYRECISKAKMFAPLIAPLTIFGESGVGKSVIARRIFNDSHIFNKVFVSAKCSLMDVASAPEQLVGTGSRKSPGLFEQAFNGTLFFDEIGDMPLAAQAILSHAIEDGVYYPVGSSSPVRFNARIITSSSKNLSAMLTSGILLREFYDTIRQHSLYVPPLRECRDEIVSFAEFFVSQLSRNNPHITAKGFSESAKRHLINHRWDGNIRELRCCVNNAVYSCDSPLIKTRHLHFEPPSRIYNDNSKDRQVIIEAMKLANNNKTVAASILGLTRPTLYSRLRKYGLFKCNHV